MSASKRLPSFSWMRPTTGKVREALISSLAPYLENARVLDIFAGTGSLGLAALDAGASEAWFIEGDKRSFKILAENVASRKNEQIKLILGKLPAALDRLSGVFDIIIADPPYDSKDGDAAFSNLERYAAPGAIVVFEHHHKHIFPEKQGALVQIKQKKYGETMLTYWQKQENSSEGEESPCI